MKKQTAMALAAVFAMSVAGTALAAPANPFVDVPAKHWAYDSLNKLAKAGVVSGYGDGTFKGDKTLTRYEVATIVAKAMANSDKADAETKKTIEALKAEFGTELNNLGVRVDNLEKKVGNIKFTGEIRERYDYQKDAVGEKATKLQTRIRLGMSAALDENITFKGRLASESKWGNESSDNQVKLDQAYLTGTTNGITYSLGRQPIFLGQGLIADTSGNNDGLVVSGGKDVKVTAAAFQSAAESYTAANIDAKLSNNLNLTVSYLKDKHDAFYKSTSAGLNYTGLKNFTVSGEFGQNDSTSAKAANGGSKAKAWMGKIKYLGAEGNKIGSLGVWVGYRKADPKFDLKDMTTLDSALQDASDNTSRVLSNIKGPEFGVEYTVFKNGILTLQYNDLKTNKGIEVDKKNFIAHLVYSF